MGGTSDKYTTIGCNFWRWEPLNAVGGDPCGISARLLWLALYSSPQSKRLVPGLWEGSLSNMARLTSVSLDIAGNALDRLVEHKLVEYDGGHQIARLTSLPDATERAHNDKAIYGWWGKFLTLPDVLIRNVHIHVLWWLVNAGKVSQTMRDVWDKTFGSLKAPPNPIPLVPAFAPAKQTTFLDPTSNQLLWSTAGRPPGLQDPDPDPDLDLEEGEGESVRGEGEVKNESASHALVLRPADEPFSVDDLVGVVTAVRGGQWLVQGQQREDLGNEILHLSPKPELSVLRDYLHGTRCSIRDAVDLLSGTGHLASAFSRARQWAQEQETRRKQADERSADLARARAEAGV